MRLQREKEREDRERSILNEYESRIEMEHRKKAEAEDTIDIMEREERDLIDRLKKTQELQQQVKQILKYLFVSVKPIFISHCPRFADLRLYCAGVFDVAAIL